MKGTITLYVVAAQNGLPLIVPVVMLLQLNTVTSLVDGIHVPLEMVHLNTFVPLPKLVTKVIGLTGFVNTPLPLISDQIPVPVDGEFAAIVVRVSQIV